MDDADYDYDAVMKIINSLRSIANRKQLEKVERLCSC